MNGWSHRLMTGGGLAGRLGGSGHNRRQDRQTEQDTNARCFSCRNSWFSLISTANAEFRYFPVSSYHANPFAKQTLRTWPT